MVHSIAALGRYMPPLLASLMLLVTAACGDTAVGPTVEEAETDTATSPTADEDATNAEQPQTVEEVLAAVDGLELDERRVELMRMAEAEEGPVLVYTSMTLMAENLDVIRPSLKEATGLDMEIYRASGEDIRARILQESGAGRHEVDVIETAARELEVLAGEGLIAPYDGPYVEALIEGSAHENWDATRLNVYTVAWNTNAVSQDERPQSYEGLGDERWAGRLTLEPSDYDWFWSVSNYWSEEKGMSEQEVDALWQQIADNATFTQGHTSTTELLGVGEYDVMASAFAPTVERFKQEGQPVEWRPPVEPLFTTPNAASAYQNTTQPASAVLFMDWLFSDAQEIFEEKEIFVTREDLRDPVLEGLDVRIIDVEQFLENEQAVMEEYEALAR